ncbi:MAG TPA: sulfatase-like hydrolase/transferase [Panacibacter sp.]|nr:sulfatase-like hydrolase/transferase [Panacibacter sp.]
MKPNNSIFGLILFFFFIISCKKQFDKRSGDSPDGSITAFFPANQKPNIILIVGDDIGREIPTYNGGESYSTPNLDFMAANGIQFPYFFSHPDGPSSRLALVTGKYGFRNYTEFGYLAPEEKTIANMLQDHGYATCFTGKWQFDGGDTSIRSHGFDKYLAYQPFQPKDNNGHDQTYHRYKNPYLYENGEYLSDSAVNGKYSEDMFFNYASQFIDSNKNNPFFLLYSHTLAQKPWVPTPDDPEFASWDPDVDDEARDDKAYFPGMVAYMDKIIGKLINKIQTEGLSNNTVIIFLGDNATNKAISSVYKGKAVNGSKDSTTFNGTNVPLVAYAPGMFAQGATDTSLLDMTDFFPTMLDIIGAKKNVWLPLDGTTFYDNLTGLPAKQRSYVYWYWTASGGSKVKSFIADYNYKLYDSLNGGGFYNITLDKYELNPIPPERLTPAEKKEKSTFAKILKNAVQQ